MSRVTGFQSGETSSIPGACVPRAPMIPTHVLAFDPHWGEVPIGHSQWRIG